MASQLNNDNIKIEVLRLSNEKLSIRKISEVTGIPRSCIGRFLRGDSFKEWWDKNQKPIAGGEYFDHHTDIQIKKSRRYILTSAQNNTYVHRLFLASLEKMAEHIDAEILVGTFSYNMSGFQNLEKATSSSERQWFDPLIKKYIVDEPVQLAEGLMWFGELNILPTAVNPLSGFQSYAKGGSGIIPHAKMCMESLPRNKQEDPRFLYTTGTVTKRNYLQKKAGQKASFHHSFGALVVEVDSDGDWFVRQLIADSSGSFYDLEHKYTPYGVEDDHTVEAINWGDIHAEKGDPLVYHTSFGDHPNSMLNVLKPSYQFIHDVLDFTSRNHHNIKDPYFIFQQHIKGRETVMDDLKDVAEVFNMLQRPFCQTVVVESNHDLALKRWLRESDYKTDPANAILFLELQLATYKAIMERKERFSVFEYSLRHFFNISGDITFLREDESFKICDEDGNGIECGSHGHLGIGGSRGTPKQFGRLGARHNTGHTHAACIIDGTYCAGVSAKLDMGYNKGASTWSHSHIVTYKNGKRAIITIKNGKWRDYE